MNFLTLVQELHRESGSGGTAPSTLSGLRGENLRLKKWVEQANNFIQQEYTDWKFLWGQHTLTTQAGTSTYAPLLTSGHISPASQIGEYDRETFFLDGDQIPVVNYLDVKSENRETATGTPWRAVIMPNDAIRLDNTPDGEYALQFDYWASPVSLVLEDDEPVFPVRFHRAIIGKALMYYGTYENAPEILQQGQIIFTDYFTALEADQLPGDRYLHRIAEGGDMVIGVE